MKIALSIGHSPKDGGAETYDKKYSEYSFWKHHLPLLQKELQQMDLLFVLLREENQTDGINQEDN